MYMDRLIPSDAFDNEARAYRHITARPYASSLGAEIVGVDVNTMGDEAVEELKDALYRHKMVFLRNQKLDDAQHLAFTRRIGTPTRDAYAQDDDPELVTPMIKRADQKLPNIFGGGWHVDSPFLPQPPAITILRSVEIPPFGGDTMFANAGLALRTLSPKMQEILAGLRVHMSSSAAVARTRALNSGTRGFASSDVASQASDGSYHPMVRTHPVTGEKVLYVSGGYSVGIEGMSEIESDLLLNFLMQHMLQHPFTCRLKWENDMLVLWDNRLCLHFAMNDYDGYRRAMHRSMVAGEVPA